MLIRNGHMVQLNFVFLEESGTFSRHFDQIEISWHSRVTIDIARWARQAIEVADNETSDAVQVQRFREH